MKPDAQRIAIAEACGWRATEAGWSHPSLPPAANVYGRMPPDYLNDLNAMHEAERVLTKDQQASYGELLLSAVPYNASGVHRDIFLCAHATAAQRAEAFLRTIGKWQEEGSK